MSYWISDFKFTRAGIYVKATETLVPVNAANTKDTLIWFVYYLRERMRNLGRKPKAKIYALPARPRAWYLLWAASWRAGYRFTTSEIADIAMAFEDSTHSHLENQKFPQGLPVINGQCTDISKSRVADIFEQVFGYSLAVDPQTYDGDIVVKSEINGVHDGYIARGPITPREGQVYQRVIDNRDGDSVLDLRCPSAGGQIDLIYIKRRPTQKRFDNYNASCALAKPEDHLSDDERETLSKFAAAMGLDWGGMDVLRDGPTGRIYVVDVNKTDMGPPIALPLKDKLRSVDILAQSLTRMIENKKAKTL